jgi:MFS family permease
MGLPKLESTTVLVALVCAMELANLLGVGAFGALLPEFRASWRLANAEAGWIDGTQQAGYLIAVPLLVGLTDRMPARRIYAAASLVTALAVTGFALFAAGLWSACLFRALAGVGLAGTFMPGLKILGDRLEGKAQSRAVAFYTACFSLGMSLSVLSAGWLAATAGWRAAFLAAGAAAGAAAILVMRLVPETPGRPTPAGATRQPILPLRRILANREAVRFSLAYAAHMWELYGVRAWLVAFLAYVAGRSGAATGPAIPSAAAIILALSLPASILGNEAALKFGRRRVLVVVMGASALMAPLVGLAGAISYEAALGAAAIYMCFVSGDSAALTAGTVGAAHPDLRGGTMAFHSLVGFAGATLGPILFGGALDLIGPDRPGGWVLAFSLLGVGAACGPPLLLRRRVT